MPGAASPRPALPHRLLRNGLHLSLAFQELVFRKPRILENSEEEAPRKVTPVNRDDEHPLRRMLEYEVGTSLARFLVTLLSEKAKQVSGSWHQGSTFMVTL